MIICCEKCNKKFDIDHNLIPKKGRLLQCNSCNHKWFFNNVRTDKRIETALNNDFEIFENKKPQNGNLIDDGNNTDFQYANSSNHNKIIKKIEVNEIEIQKKNNFLNLFIVCIITFVGLIILLDTFKNPLKVFFPDIEFLLYNLYESIKDIILFIKDLI
mgnify:CR=1 FL=1|tara:strand:- start:177 stop:653 length:477 start_codon:yes stop_codon:yes gene_type:complete